MPAGSSRSPDSLDPWFQCGCIHLAGGISSNTNRLEPLPGSINRAFSASYVAPKKCLTAVLMTSYKRPIACYKRRAQKRGLTIRRQPLEFPVKTVQRSRNLEPERRKKETGLGGRPLSGVEFIPFETRSAGQGLAK
jgi:hypothetical protein